MSHRTSSAKKLSGQGMKEIRRATRRHFSAEDKIRIVLDVLRSEDVIVELFREEGLVHSLYYTCSTEFMEAYKSKASATTACLGMLARDMNNAQAATPPRRSPCSGPT
jgi:transposase